MQWKLLFIIAFLCGSHCQQIKKFEQYQSPPGWCLAPVDPGYCSGEYVQKWAYSKKWRRCLPFQYSGCGGMYLNRFNTWFQCAILCEFHLSSY